MKRILTLAFVALAMLILTGAARDVRQSSENIQHPIAAVPFDLMIAHETDIGGIYIVNKFGYNGVTSATEESIWDADDLPTAGAGPARCFGLGTTPAALYISSDDALDAGLTVTVEYLIADYVPATTTVTLGADTGVTGTEFVQIGAVAILRVNRAYAAGAALTGNVYIHKDSEDAVAKDGIPDTPATDIIAGITAGENQTLQACYTVPAGFRAVVSDTCFSNIHDTGTANAATFRFRASVEGAASRTKHLLGLGDGTSICGERVPPELFGEKTDIEVTAVATAQEVTATFGLYIIPEDFH